MHVRDLRLLDLFFCVSSLRKVSYPGWCRVEVVRLQMYTSLQLYVKNLFSFLAALESLIAEEQEQYTG